MAFRAPERSGGLVLKVPTEGNSAREDPGHRVWAQCMSRVQGQDIPLLPPFEILLVQGVYGVVMPYAEVVKGVEYLERLGLRGLEGPFRQRLRDLGLKLSDVLQLGLIAGSLFSIDWSDLGTLD